MMGAVVIAVCTRDRPVSLGRCLASLAELRLSSSLSLKLLIVDNGMSLEGSTGILDAMKSRLAGLSPELLHEPRPGIPIARNRALEFARASNADAVIFLDDDQTVAPDWAVTLCRVQQEEGCDAVKCEVRWIFEPPQKFQEFFRRMSGGPSSLRERYASYNVATNGVLISKRLWGDWGLRFNENFALTGGTDVEFFARAWRQGAVLFHTSETFATEFCDADKQTVSWLARRAFRIGNMEALMRLGGETRMQCFGKGLWWIPYNAVIAALRLPRPYASLKHLLKMARGAGLVLGALGIRWEEYRKVVGS
ncbi:glycosyltransferase family A protein [Parvibaculum sp.]|uniref:glycosyltransferase family 2 protein n=1 Tax=Parvibaculum sp. TaxID=2024848 RepID=UPI002B96F85C|nr:glycosyltransferase family A protein [Parvibaculum sp.]HUD50177.1 glycosyltransferase family A protein [Parvibaculum sp.]